MKVSIVLRSTGADGKRMYWYERSADPKTKRPGTNDFRSAMRFPDEATAKAFLARIPENGRWWVEVTKHL